jgi:hypothetical protein
MTEPTDLGLPGRFITDPDRAFTVWPLADIYIGPLKPGKYVPNVDDLVFDWTQGFFRVAGVDYTTGLSTLVPWTIKTSPSETTDEDVLLGVGPGGQSEMWRVRIDARTVPHTLDLDGRLHIYGSDAQYCKVFKGTDISINGKVISAFYDQNDTFLGENIPFMLVANEYANNRAVKAPMTGYTSISLPDGEVVTVVVYGASGNVIYREKMLIENTSLVRRTSANMRYVTAIDLLSPFMSESSPDLIEFPINVNIGTVMMMGRVTFSNGETVDLPISEDGETRFSLFGLRSYVPTLEGQTVPLTLNYVLAANEYAYIQGPTENGSITERYRARTTKVDKAYSVKLYAYPVWKDATTGYQLEFWLYNLDRREFSRVNRGQVEVQAGARNFDGLDFLTTQTLSLSINLNDIDPKYSAYRHVQTFKVSLRAPGNERRTNWTIQFNPGSPEMYGNNLEAEMTFIDTNYWLVKISNGFHSKEEWLRNVFYAAQPLYDMRSEIEAPVPTHFALRTKTRRVEFSVEAWNNDLQIYNDLEEGENIAIEWIRRTPVTDLQLGVSALSVHMVTQAP